MAKEKKQRAESYEEKLKIEGTLKDVIGVSVDVLVKKEDKLKEQKEDVPGTDHDGLKKQDKPIK